MSVENRKFDTIIGGIRRPIRGIIADIEQYGNFSEKIN